MPYQEPEFLPWEGRRVPITFVGGYLGAGKTTAINEVLTPDQQEMMRHPVKVEMKKGHCSFHHPLMVHGSYENRTDGPRRAVVLNTFRDGVQSNSDETLLEGVPPIASGHKMEGQFFPLLFDPARPA